MPRRFPVKTMFMGIVARPQKHHDFNGKIFMKRVSKKRYLGTMTNHGNFSEDAIIISQIKSDEWNSLIDVTVYTDEDLRHFFSCTYELEDYIVEILEFYFTSKIGNNGNSKNVVIPTDADFNSLRTHDDKEKPPRHVSIEDISVRICNKKVTL